MELASFDRFNPTHETFLDQLTESIGIVLNTIEANMRTEDLLKQSQSLARELQSQQEELQQTNAELEDKAKLLAEQNVEVERKNKEVEQARQALEEKAKQLALTSKYKSEFLANMSHELRTPLNSLLILSDQLSKNAEGNLTGRQVEFCQDDSLVGQRSAGVDQRHSGPVEDRIGHGHRGCRRHHLPRSARLSWTARSATWRRRRSWNSRSTTDAALPREVHTDAKRLQQILKNLLSNAFKFTEQGRLTLEIGTATSGWNQENQTLNRAKSVIAFSVQGYRHRHPAGEAGDHFRGVPAGGWKHQPQIRRHGAGPGDQPRTGAVAGRRNSADQRSRAREARSRCICRRRMSRSNRLAAVAEPPPQEPVAASSPSRLDRMRCAVEAAADRSRSSNSATSRLNIAAGRPRAADC